MFWVLVQGYLTFEDGADSSRNFGKELPFDTA
jgi:hypothetical protein